MKTTTISLEAQIGAAPREVYDAYLSSEIHGKIINADAVIESEVGANFSAWAGSIHGEIQELLPGEKIVQSWRAESEKWPDGHFSTLTLEFKPEGSATQLVLTHENVPSDDVDSVTEGWNEFYFKGLRAYFG